MMYGTGLWMGFGWPAMIAVVILPITVAALLSAAAVRSLRSQDHG